MSLNTFSNCLPNDQSGNPFVRIAYKHCDVVFFSIFFSFVFDMNLIINSSLQTNSLDAWAYIWFVQFTRDAHKSSGNEKSERKALNEMGKEMKKEKKRIGQRQKQRQRNSGGNENIWNIRVYSPLTCVYSANIYYITLCSLCSGFHSFVKYLCSQSNSSTEHSFVLEFPLKLIKSAQYFNDKLYLFD